MNDQLGSSTRCGEGFPLCRAYYDILSSFAGAVRSSDVGAILSAAGLVFAASSFASCLGVLSPSLSLFLNMDFSFKIDLMDR